MNKGVYMKVIKILYNKKTDVTTIETIDPKKLKKAGLTVTQDIDIISDSIVDLKNIKYRYLEYLKKGVD